jgi:predicted DNA binding CopG/RHH family protein
MARKRFASSARGKQAAKNARHMPDSRPPNKIDFSDIPESTDEELKRARRVGRPRTGHAKQLIAIRIAPRLLAQLRRLAAKQDKPYQTLIHELLEKAAKRKVA